MGDFLCEFAAFKYSNEPLQMEFTYNFSAGLDRWIKRHFQLSIGHPPSLTNETDVKGSKRCLILDSSELCCTE